MSKFGVRVSQGDVRGYEPFRKFGYNPNIGSTEEYIGSGDGPWHPTVAVPIGVSASNDDTITGTGAQKVTVEGLDENWRQVTQVIDMAGQTTVLTNPMIRFHRGYVSQPGVYGGSNLGPVLFKDQSMVIADIARGFGQTQVSGYCVPARRVLSITSVHAVISAGRTMDLIFWQAPGANETGTKRVVQQYNGLTAPDDFSYDPPMPFEAYTDLWFTAKVEASVGLASVEYVGYLGR